MSDPLLPPPLPAPGPDAPDAEPRADAEQRLDAIVVGYWLVSGLVSTGILGGLLFAASWYATTKWPEQRPLLLASVGGLVGLFALTALVTPPLAYARWRFAVGQDLLRMRSGILFHEEKVIPISRLQHVDLLRGPIERLFGLATLVVWTAGNEGASFRLQGLRAARAAGLRDVILAARGDDVV